MTGTESNIASNGDQLSAPPKARSNSGKNVLGYFKEYCEATSIHGFKYFGENRTISEKIWWLTVFTVSLICCTFAIMSVYKKWDQSPVIVTFATRGKHISEIPFPALTICAESKIKQEIFDYKSAVIRRKRGEDLNETEELYLGHLGYICDYRDGLNYTSLNYSDSDFIATLMAISPDFSILNCEFATKKRSCDQIFFPIVTDDGLCYTFNILDRKDMYNENVLHHTDFHDVGKRADNWNLEHGYSEGSKVYAYPQRAFLAGARYGLKFELSMKSERLDTLCRGSVEGFRLVFHAPTQLPRPSEDYIRVPYNRVLSATIRPSHIMTSEAVKNYPSEKRQCYFPSEKKLKYFKVYNQRNCDTECLTNYTLATCNCTIFYMPRENGTRICGAADYDCTLTAESDLQYYRLYNRIALKNKKRKPLKIKEAICHCMPMCSAIEYRIGSSQSIWNWSEEIESGLLSINETDDITQYHLTRVRTYFVSSNFIGSERNELYGPTDFLANFGGLLGLFTGFSILSLMEIIYFLTIRIICNVRLHDNWAGVNK